MAEGTTIHSPNFVCDPKMGDQSPTGSERSALFHSGQSRDEATLAERRHLQLRQSISAEEDYEGGDTYGAGVFLDVAVMKDKVRDALKKPTYNVQDYYCETGIWQRIAKSALFEQITLGVIAFNAIWIAVDTDSNDAEILLEAAPIFQIAENFFCTFFTFELLSRFMAFKRKRNCLRDTWFVFDSVLVFMMVVETWVMSLVVVLSEGGGSGGFGNASVLRIARLLRLSRMARMVRLLRIMPELMIMIKGMMAAIRSVFFTLLLLVIIMYIFGIAFTQLLSGTEVGVKHYQSVPASMYTLLIYGTLLDDIGTLTKEMGTESIAITGLFLMFVLVAALTVMNMLIGVLCEVVSAVAATEKEEMLISWVKSKIEKIFEEVDTDNSKTVTRKEFMSILENALACRALQDVGVDVVGLVDFADVIFEDEGVGEKELTFHDFMDVVLQLRGCNNATVKDIVDLRKLVQKVGTQTGVAIGQIAALSDGIRMSRSTNDRWSNPDLLKSGRSDPRHSTESNTYRVANGTRSPKRVVASTSTSSTTATGGFVPEAEGEPPKKAFESFEPWSDVVSLQSQLTSNGVSQLSWDPLAKILPLNYAPKVVEVCHSSKPDSHESKTTNNVHQSCVRGNGVALHANSPNYFQGKSPSDNNGHEVKEWHNGVDSGGVQIQIKRLNDALHALASVRNDLVGCVAHSSVR